MTAYGNFNKTARAVLVIGRTPIVLDHYNLLANNYLESDTLNTSIPANLLDISSIFTEYQSQNKIIPVELWCGFLNQNEEQTIFTQSFSRNYDANDPNNNLKEDILENYDKKLDKRWNGYLSNFEFTFSSTSSDKISLFCFEIIQILHRFKYEKVFSGDKATVKNIISDLNNYFKSFNFIVDLPEKFANFNMGTKDKVVNDESGEQESKVEYMTAGKTLYGIIKEICDRLDLDFIQTENQFEYKLALKKSSKKIFTIDRATDFSALQIRNAKVGDVATNGFTIFAISQQSDGKVKVGCSVPSLNKKIRSYKELYKGNTVIKARANLSEDQLNSIAFDTAQNLAKYTLSGNATLLNPITNIHPNDGIKFIDTSLYADKRSQTNFIKFLNSGEGKFKNVNFVINTINESYQNEVGINQTIEFNLNPELNVYDKDSGELLGKELIPASNEETEENNVTMPPFLLQKIQNNFI